MKIDSAIFICRDRTKFTHIYRFKNTQINDDQQGDNCLAVSQDNYSPWSHRKSWGGSLRKTSCSDYTIGSESNILISNKFLSNPIKTENSNNIQNSTASKTSQKKKKIYRIKKSRKFLGLKDEILPVDTPKRKYQTSAVKNNDCQLNPSEAQEGLPTDSKFKKRQSEQYKVEMDISQDSSYNLIPQYSFH